MWNPFKKDHRARHPTDARLNELLDAYAEVLSNESNPLLMDEWCLPATKKELKLALLAALASSASEAEKALWRCNYMCLASFLPGVGPKGIRETDAQDHGRLPCEIEWVQKFAAESDHLKSEIKQLAKLRTDPSISVLEWFRDLKS